MSEVETQTASTSAPVEESSRTELATSATELAPVENAQQPITPPQEANADLQPEPLPDGKTGDAVDNNEDDYEQQKAAMRAGKLSEYIASKAPKAETPTSAPAPTPPPSAAPTEVIAQPSNADDLTDIGAAPEPDGRLAAMKLRPSNPQERQLLSEWKASKAAGNEISLTEFILARHVPTAKAADAPDATNPDTPAADKPREFNTIADVTAEMERLREAEYAELEAFNPAGAKEHRKAFDALVVKLPALQNQIAAQEQEAATAATTAWNASLGQAQKLFGDAGKAGTALEAAAVALRQEWVAKGHPLAHSADSAVALYAEAAARIGAPVAPANPSLSPRPNVSTPSPVHRPALSPFIGGGDGRTTQQPQAPAISDSLDDYDREKAALLKRSQNGSRQMAVA